MYVPSVRRPFGATPVPTVNATPWVAGSILLVAAVFIPHLTKKLKKGLR